MERKAGAQLLLVLPKEADLASVEVLAQRFGAGCRIVHLGPQRMSEIDQGVLAIAAAFSLTLREQQVLREVMAGHSNPQIADKLGIATSTVKTHLETIFHRTDTSRRHELCGLVYRCVPPG
jgi:DNA-binding CsgD family transcriptional regulator